ncbi:hypothetical protein ACSBR2_014306 [Camellia fascicularis]
MDNSFGAYFNYGQLDLTSAYSGQLVFLGSAEVGGRSASELEGSESLEVKTFLLTIPPSVGYDNNPLSLYYCHEVEGSTKNLKQCIAEVTNSPWGERVPFLFDPTTDLVAKSLHVSPFMVRVGEGIRMEEGIKTEVGREIRMEKVEVEVEVEVEVVLEK